MAPVLLCPECGAKHPLDGVGGSAFPCSGCGRTLKVPQKVPAPAGVGGGPDPDLPWPQAGGAASTSTRVLPTTPPPGPPPAMDAPAAETTAPPAPRPPSRRSGPRDPVPARWLRFVLWIVAVPLGFVIVFALAQLIGVLNSDQLEDVALSEGWTRFMPIARLLPFVALATAALVQGGVYGLTRWRAKRSGAAIPERRPA
jgi:hypothetical protein